MPGNRVVLTFIGDDSSLRASVRSVEDSMDRIGPSATRAGLGIAGVGASSVAAGVIAGGALAALPLLFGAIGIAGAVQAEKVKSAFTSLGDHVKSQMAGLTAPIQGELVDVAGKLTSAFDRVAPRLGEIFGQVAPQIGVFVDGISRLVEGFIGSAGLKSALDAAGPFVKILADGLAGLGPALGQFFGNLTQGAGGAATAFTGFFDVLNWLIPALGNVIGWLAQMLPVLGPLVAAGLAIVAVIRVWTAVQAILNLVLAANPLMLIVIAIAALVAAFVYAYTSSQTFRDIVNGVFSAVTGFIGGAVDWIKAAIGWFGNLPGLVGGWFGSMRDAAIARGLDLVNWVRSVPGLIMGAIGNLGSILLNAGRDLLSGLWSGIQGAAGWLKSKVLGFFGSILPGWVKDILGIASPSKVFADLGKYLPKGMALGIDHNVGSVISSARSMTDAVVTAARVPEMAAFSGQASAAISRPTAATPAAQSATTVNFKGNTTNALAAVIQEMVRTGKIEITA